MSVIVISEEVEKNRILASEKPWQFRLATTALVSCGGDCGKYFLVFAKDANFTKWDCLECA